MLTWERSNQPFICEIVGVAFYISATQNRSFCVRIISSKRETLSSKLMSCFTSIFSRCVSRQRLRILGFSVKREVLVLYRTAIAHYGSRQSYPDFCPIVIFLINSIMRKLKLFDPLKISGCYVLSKIEFLPKQGGVLICEQAT